MEECAMTYYQDQAHYRKIFVKHNGEGPYTCFFCGDEITCEAKGRLRLTIHHKNHNHDDDRKSNLKPAHLACHSRYHNEGVKRSPETRVKMSEANKGKILSPETRAKMSEVNKGKVLTPEHRAKIGAAHRGMKHSPEARAKMRVAAIGNTNRKKERK
jgi:NUMOD3 motif